MDDDRAHKKPDYDESWFASLVVTAKFNGKGSYFEIRKVCRSDIDASCLRTCKKLYSEGIRQLYSNTAFGFDMTAWKSDFYPYLYGIGKIHQPDPSKKHVTNLDIETALSQIQDRVPETDLPGWVYYDRFLRFLYVIGPQNASRIKALKFKAMVKLHSCKALTSNISAICCPRACPQVDIVENFSSHVPFIRKFCPGLEKLTIVAEKDRELVSPGMGMHEAQLIDKAHKEALKAFLNGEIRTIESLTELTVLDEQNNSERTDIAEETINFIRSRAIERAHAKCSEESDEMEADIEWTL